MKRQDKNRSLTLFFRAFFITALLLAAAVFAVFGSAKAYTAIRKNAFGETGAAIAVQDDGDDRVIKIFDYEVRF